MMYQLMAERRNQGEEGFEEKMKRKIEKVGQAGERVAGAGAGVTVEEDMIAVSRYLSSLIELTSCIITHLRLWRILRWRWRFKQWFP